MRSIAMRREWVAFLKLVWDETSGWISWKSSEAFRSFENFLVARRR